MGSAGGGSAAGLDVDEVFSTFLHTGTGSSQTITNGIDLSTEGGLVWLKIRNDDGSNNILYDTVRPLISGNISRLIANSTNAVNEGSNEVNSFTSTGFTLGGSYNTNGSSLDYVSWTFRKAPKFFDVVKYVGNGSTQTISHNLGSVPGMMIVKCLDNGGNWRVFHTSVGNTKGGYLAENLEFDDDVYWNDTTPTSTVFTVGNKSDTNGNNLNYIAYLFAHNNNDGEFGPDGDQDIIKCGSYTGNGSSTGPSINLGFEPQWVMVKSATQGGSDNDWYVVDTMRRFEALPQHDAGSQFLKWNTNDDEPSSGQAQRVAVNSTGFSPIGASTGWNINGQTYIYMAIRRGPLAAPDDATKVFAMDTLGGTSPTPPGFNSGFPVDMAFLKPITSSSDWLLASRLIQGKQLVTNSTAAEVNETANVFDYQNGYYNFSSSASNYQAWMWKRAPEYFDVVCYSGTGSARTVSHNLDVEPEIVIVKQRSSGNEFFWYVKSLGNTKKLELPGTAAAADAAVGGNQLWNSTTPTSSVFSVSDNPRVNDSGETYIAYLFATVAGVSKVGSYTGNGSSQNIDCGFSSGARFVLIKRTNSGGDWWIFDTARGIVSGNDPYLKLNTSDAEYTESDEIDPLSSGFTVNETGNTTLNTNTHTYIFYAIA